jgi:hypothetical protein
MYAGVCNPNGRRRSLGLHVGKRMQQQGPRCRDPLRTLPRRADELAGAERVGVGLDIEALVGWFKASSPIGPTPERVTNK